MTSFQSGNDGGDENDKKTPKIKIADSSQKKKKIQYKHLFVIIEKKRI